MWGGEFIRDSKLTRGWSIARGNMEGYVGLSDVKLNI